MASCGLQSLFPMEELALGSMAESLPRLPRLWRRLAQAVHEVDRRRTDLVLTIASPGVALRLQRRLTGRPLVRVHYGAPQTWAWREERAARLARHLDYLLALLPFEPALFRRHGISSSFVGHPIVEEVPTAADGARFRRRYKLPADAPLLCLLPGSEESEIRSHLLVLEQTVALIWRRISQLRLVLPTTPRMAPLVKAVVARWKLPVLVL